MAFEEANCLSVEQMGKIFFSIWNSDAMSESFSPHPSRIVGHGPRMNIGDGEESTKSANNLNRRP
jgi:hypothetical protein